MQKIFGSIILLLIVQSSIAQVNEDSAAVLDKVVVTAFEQNRSTKQSGFAITRLNFSNADRSNKGSFIAGFNSVAGVRMEERSPASYRINIRGSALRSPFGVRNIKIYWNDLPVTDPSGNSYFNQFAYNNFSFLEVYKGPVSSMYGAGTGGLILMQSFESSWKPSVKAEYVVGNWGLHNILLSTSFGNKDNHSLITYSHHEGNGYRDHSRMKRDNATFVTENKISEKQQIKASILFNNLFYETPGGLTLTEFNANPKSARPAAGGFPSADGAKAAIFQKNFLAGLSHIYSFNHSIRNTTVLYGSFAEIKNPTFRNYERRIEPSFGGRSVFSYTKKTDEKKITLVSGIEIQHAFFNTQVSRNRQGIPDTLQTNDDVRFNNMSIFFQADAELRNWILTGGLSLNRSDVSILRLNKYPVIKQSREYNSEWSPRISILRKLGDQISVYATITKGFSPPTISELLPSTGVISTFLEAESGTNYEIGAKWASRGFQIELNGYYFRLNDALVGRKDSSNADFFVNAGNTKQKGIELSSSYFKGFSPTSVFRTLMTSLAYTLSNYRFGSYRKETTEFGGKRLPGVPENTISILADLQLRNGIYLNSTFYFASKIFMNDANTISADDYSLLGIRLGYKLLSKKARLNFYVGSDNLMNQTYSLGNDINAAGGRYYNPAALRNYYGGIAWELNY